MPKGAGLAVCRVRCIILTVSNTYISKLQNWLKEESENSEPPTLADYIQGKLKPAERRLATLKKHIEQADIYFKYKGKKPLTEAEQILFTTAKDYLKGVMNGKTALPLKAWKEEYTKLTAERKTLNQRYLVLKEEVKEAEKIRKSVYSILRQEQREQQPRRTQDMER